MQAINHVATALILKRKFPATPMFSLIIATEGIELFWVALNVLGIEQMHIASPMRSVADVHLFHMPYSHSVATSAVFAALVGGIVFWRSHAHAHAYAKSIATAISLALFSHIVLDLLVHAPDIQLMPFPDGDAYGTGLYSDWPLLALGLETLWGILCWKVYHGNWRLLGLILALNILSLPVYAIAIDGGEAALVGEEGVFALLILAQILVSSLLLWRASRKVEEAKQSPTSHVTAST